MNYLSVAQTAEKWEMTSRRVQVLCNEGRINGAQRVGNVWTIPENAEKPVDGRKKIIKERKTVNSNISIERVWAMPNKNTFEIKPIQELLQEEVDDGFWIDPFANRNKIASVTNDLNEEFDTDYHMDALDFMKMFDTASVDGVLYDPPYSPRQVSECYNNVGYNVTWDTTKASFWGNHKKEISRIVKLGGKVITFGWNSGGIGYKYGFEIERILLVPHGGWHNDTICTVEVKTHEGETLVKKEKKDETSYPMLELISRSDKDQQLIDLFESLPTEFWDFKNEDVREFTHGLHNYPAMMVSPISRNIIRMVKQTQEVNTLLDPFMGSGTVLVEGVLAGINSVFGSDINPFAVFLSRVKTKKLDINELQKEVNALYKSITDCFERYELQIEEADGIIEHKYGLDLTEKEGWGKSAPMYLDDYIQNNHLNIKVPNFKNIGYWFKPRVILLLSLIKEQILKINDDDIKNFVFVAFSETIRFVSNRRNGEFKMFRMKPDKVKTFHPDVIKEFRTILDRNTEKMNAYIEVCDEIDSNSSVVINNENAASLSSIKDESIDLIITSPPYGDSRTTVAYGEYSRLSLQWLDLYGLDEHEIMGIDKTLMGGSKYRNGFEYDIPSKTLFSSLERIKDIDLERAGDVFSFYSDLKDVIRTTASKTKQNGLQFWVVGNRTVKGEVLQTDRIIAEIAGECGLDYVYTIDRNIINKVMPALNSPSNETGKKSSTMTNEHIVVLRKR